MTKQEKIENYMYMMSLDPNSLLKELFETPSYRIFKTKKLIKELKSVASWNPKTGTWDNVWKSSLNP